jgi:hypothetical protein
MSSGVLSLGARWLQRLPAEHAYAALATIFGLVFVFVTPPFQSPDEPNHFLRSYQLAHFQRGLRVGDTSGAMLPATLVRDTHTFDALMFRVNARTSRAAIVNAARQSGRLRALRADLTTFAPYPNTVRYAPFAYVPSITALWISEAANLTTIEATYVCRTTTLAMAIALIWLSIRIAPSGLKWALGGLALTPMALFIVGMTSTDALLISVSFLVFAQAARLSVERNGAILQSSIVLVLILGILVLAPTKLVYLLIPLAVPIALWPRCRSSAQRAMLTVAVAAGSIVVALGWLAAIWTIRTPPLPDPAIDSYAQLMLVLQRPMVFVHAVMADLAGHASRYTDSFLGKLGWLDVFLPRWVLNATAVLLLLFSLTSSARDEHPMLSAAQRAALLSIAVLTFAMSMFLQYLDWVPVGYPTLRGVLQGRYYYPIAPAIAMAAPHFHLPASWSMLRPWVFTIGFAIVLGATANTLIARYY